MRLRHIILFMSLLLGPWLVRAQNAQPAIITFDADLPSITVDAAEAGQTSTTLSWHVINVSSSQHLVVEQRSLNAWVSVVPGDETLLPVGSLLVPVQHPLDFGPPTYRLRLLDASDNLLDERIISIPYEIPADSQPSIEVFSSSTATLLGGSDGGLNAEHVNVTWKVINRVPGSNLVFDQVLENGQSVPVELPRDNLWVASQGSGDLAPVPPLSSNVIQLRLRVMDMVSSEVYDEATIEIVIGGGSSVAAASTPAEAENAPPVPTVIPHNCSTAAQDVPISGAPGDGCDTYLDSDTGTVTRVAAFSVDSADIVPGRGITLTWQVEGAQFALLEIYNPAQLAQGGLPEPAVQVFDGLPTSGSTTVTLPASLDGGARFILWAANLSAEARSPSFLYERLAYRIIDVQGGQIDAAAQILAFVALPPAAPPGTQVTLSWNLHGADSALIELYNLETNTLAGVFEDLPIIGSANIIIPDAFTRGARFVLWATNKNPDGSTVRLAQSSLEVPAG